MDMNLLLEAERRGILPEDKKPLLAEARRRGLVTDGGSPGQKSNQQPDMSGLEKFGVGVGYGMTQLGKGALQTVLRGGEKIRKMTGMQSNQGNIDKLQSSIDADRASMAPLNDSYAAKGGEFTGGVLPTFLMPGGVTKSIIGKMAVAAGQGGVIGALQPTSGDESRLTNTGTGMAAGAGTSAVLSGASKIAPLVGKLAKQTIGATTGAGPGAVEEAIKGSKAFKNALRGNVTGDDVVDTARDALNTIRSKRAGAYQQKLAEVTNNKAPIDLNEIKTQVTDNLKNFVKYTETKTIPGATTAAISGPKYSAGKYPNGGGFAIQDANGKYVTMKSGHASFFADEKTANAAAARMTQDAGTQAQTTAAQVVPGRFNWSRTSVGDIKNSKDAKELKTIYDKVQNWGTQPGDNTAVELDRLKRDLENYYSDSSRVRAFVAHAKDTVNNAIIKNVPEYGEMTKGYAQATSMIKDIESGLMMRKQGMSGRVTADQTLRRLTSAMRENFEMRKDLVEALGKQGGEDVAGQVAGYSMEQLIPRGLVGKLGAGSAGYIAYLNPKLLPVLMASSPRVMGEFLMAFGKAHRALSKLPAAPAMNVLPKAAAVEATQPDQPKRWKEIE